MSGRDFFPNREKDEPEYTYHDISEVCLEEVKDKFCFFCKFDSVTEAVPEVQSAFFQLEKMLKETHTASEWVQAENLHQKYNQCARQYIEGNPECTADTFYKCITGKHPRTDINGRLRHGSIVLGQISSLIEKRLVIFKDGKYETLSKGDVDLYMRVMNALKELKE